MAGSPKVRETSSPDRWEKPAARLHELTVRTYIIAGCGHPDVPRRGRKAFAISPRTVEMHRAHISEKLGVPTAAAIALGFAAGLI